MKHPASKLYALEGLLAREYLKTGVKPDWQPKDKTEENLQARIRGTILNPKKSPETCFQCHTDKRGHGIYDRDVNGEALELLTAKHNVNVTLEDEN